MSSDEEKRGTDRMPIELKVEYKRLNTFLSDYTKNISSGGTFIRDRKSTRLNSSHLARSRMPSSA